MVDYSSRVTIYTLTEDEGNNTATLAISETNTEAKPLTVTAHFEKADAGHFLSYDYCELQPLVFDLLPGYKKAASITGWSNDASEDIVVKFNELGSDNKVTALLGYTTWGGLKRVADGVEFKFDSADATNYSKGGIGQKLKIGADAYAVGFTMTDKDGTVKKGTILLQYPGRAQVEAENGKLEYNGTEYKNGDVITFTPAAEETVSAKAADGYHLKEWIIDGTTYAGTEDGSVTFTVPDKFFSIKPVFEKTLAAVTITAASSNAGGTVTASAEKAVPGGAGVTLTATPKEGYRLDGWTVSYTNGDPMVDYSSRVTIYTLTEDEGNNTATLAISETNTEAKPLTVTAHFEKADAGHFLSYDYCELQPLVFDLLPGYKKAASITGWSNDASEDIVVKFNELGSDNKVTALLGYTTWGGLKRVADGVEFKFDSADATNYSKGGIGQKLKIGADAYAVGFTMTDKDGTVKKGTILLQYK